VWPWFSWPLIMLGSLLVVEALLIITGLAGRAK
jgi:hypothetical protein